MLGLVSASIITGGATQDQDARYSDDPERNQGDESEVKVMASVGVKATAGEYVGEGGKEIQIQERDENRVRLRVGNYSADCECNLTQNKTQDRTRFYAQLSNGRNAEVKIMPDVASETALTRLRLRVCSAENNCSIELKEVGRGDNAELAYELRVRKEARVFGLFRTRMQVSAEVNAENGEIIRTGKPWWAFLASESEEVEE